MYLNSLINHLKILLVAKGDLFETFESSYVNNCNDSLTARIQKLTKCDIWLRKKLIVQKVFVELVTCKF